MKKTAKKKSPTRPTIWATRDKKSTYVELWVGKKPVLAKTDFNQGGNPYSDVGFWRTSGIGEAFLKGFNLWDLKPGECRKVEVK